MGWDAPWHWIVLAILVIALFGYKKLPDASRAVGRSLRIFKSEIKGMSEDDQKRQDAAGPAQLPPAQSTTQPAPELTPQITPQNPATNHAANPATNHAPGGSGAAR